MPLFGNEMVYFILSLGNRTRKKIEEEISVIIKK